MNLETFFDNFDLLADAPNGVQKLRELILQLAVMGKLVPQDANDELIQYLLKDISETKKLLLKEGKLQQDKKFSPLIKTSPPWKIPAEWGWIRLQDIFEISRGGSPRPSGDPSYFGGDIPWITVYEITKDTNRYLTYTQNGLTELGSTKSRFIYPEDLLLTNSGATLGVPKISKIKGCINDGVAKLNSFHNGIYKEYAYCYLFQQTQAFRQVNQGMGQPNLNTSILAGWYFPLPPLAEQHRIVAKVDELMALCHRLSERQQKRRSTRIIINNAAIGQLLTAREPEVFNKSWQHICNNFDLLYSTPDNIGKLRRAILQLAVQGKLVSQDENDEPALVLLEKIKLEKERLVKEGKIKKDKLCSPIELDKIPSEVPKGWAVERLGNLVIEFQNGISTRKSEKGEPIPVIRLADIKNGQQLSKDSLREISLTDNEKYKYKVNKGDILVIRVNGSAELVGRFVPCLTDEEWAYCDHLIRVRIPVNLLNYQYFCLFGSTNEARQHLIDKTITTAGQKTINQGGLASLIVWVPPLAEQHRIVAKVNQLMTLCDTLETKLTQSVTDSEKLMEAAVRQILAANSNKSDIHESALLESIHAEAAKPETKTAGRRNKKTQQQCAEVVQLNLPGFE